jgi:hypothetical protein
LRDAHLKINPKKCKLLKREVAYLGHTISEQGIQTDPEKIEAVKSWPYLKTLGMSVVFWGFAPTIGNSLKIFQ